MGSISRLAGYVVLALAAIAAWAAPASAASKGVVYTSTNDAGANAVLAFERAADGSLKARRSFPTEGLGTGGGLGNQGALALADGGAVLYAVNAGSDDISTFAVRRSGLRLVGTTPSGGDQPISLTVRRGLLYALNAGDGEITGFSRGDGGELEALSDSTQPISGEGPAQVAFSKDGGSLVVTNKATSTIDTFAVDDQGRPGAATSNPSEGETPFGFDFDRAGHLIVSEAFGGAAGASAVSSYSLAEGGALDPISPSVPDNEAAACWIEVTKDSRFAYTTNTASNSISSYSVAPGGSIELLEQLAAETGAGTGPTDLAESKNGRFLLTLLPGTGDVASYRIRNGGGLALVDQAGGVGGAATGLEAE